MTGTDYGIELVGTGVIVVGLAAGYYLIKKAGITTGEGKQIRQEKV
jgi:hypothetical protein